MPNLKRTYSGVLDKTYATGRKNKKSWKYRAERRSQEVINAIKKHHPLEIKSLLDIGASDGLMLGKIKKEFPDVDCLGLEYSKDLIDSCDDKSIKILQGDAQNLPFQNDSFDVVIATAIIEHLDQPFEMLRGGCRILKKDGILILTTPDPFFEKIAALIGNIEKEKHTETFNLKKLKKYFENAGLKVIQTNKFMLSPAGFPFEIKIEKLLKFIKLDFVLLNQIIIGKK